MRNNHSKIIETIFPISFKLGDNRSLFEEDFHEVHRRYFDEIDDCYLIAINSSRKNLIFDYGFDWPDFYVKSALDAILSNHRPDEKINTWRDVSYEYQYYFSDSCVSLSSEGFYFFLPAALFNYFEFRDLRNINFIFHFINRLHLQWDQDKCLFDKHQIIFIKKIVEENFRGQVGWCI
jgi:hypothetical protein